MASLLKITKIDTRYKDRKCKMSLNKTLKTLLISFSFLSTATALSSEIFSDNVEEKKGTLCFADAGEKHNVDERILIAIAKYESNFNERAVSPNKDGGGHTSYGIMQISDVWKPLLEKNGLTIEDLYEPCKNIQLGAYLYKKDPKNFGKKWRKYIL